MFSGRPNPSWWLSPAESDDLAERVSRLAQDGEPGTPPGLGYRGFVVHRVNAGTSHPWLRVGLGVVRVMVPAGSLNFTDDVGIEAWLRERAVERGFGMLAASSSAAKGGPNV